MTDSSDEASNSSIDQLSDTFLHLNINNDPELVLQYKMLAFIYNKDYMKCVHFNWVWQEFLVDHPEITFTGMELKLEFCIQIMAKIDEFKYLSTAQKTYFKSRVINKNADELLRHCDLEPGVDVVSVSDNPTFVTIENLNAANLDFYGREKKCGPMEVGCTKVAKEEPKERSLIQLLAMVFGTPDQSQIRNRIAKGIHKKEDFKDTLQKFLQTQDESLHTPQEDILTVQSLHQTPEEQQEMQHVSSGFAQNSEFSASTPLSSHVPRRVSRANSDQQGSRQRRRSRSAPRPTSADRGGESFRRFADRIKARSKPRRLPRN